MHSGNPLHPQWISHPSSHPPTLPSPAFTCLPYPASRAPCIGQPQRLPCAPPPPAPVFTSPTLARGPHLPHPHPTTAHPTTAHPAFCCSPHLDVWHPSAHVEVIEVLISSTLHHVGARADVGFARPGLERVIAPGLCEESVEVETCHGQGCLAAASAEGAPALAVHGECPVIRIPMRMNSGKQGVWPGLKKITAVINTKRTR